MPQPGGEGPQQSVKWFFCSLCVWATVGSTCVNDTAISFIVREVGGVRVSGGNPPTPLTHLQEHKHACAHTKECVRWGSYGAEFKNRFSEKSKNTCHRVTTPATGVCLLGRIGSQSLGFLERNSTALARTAGKVFKNSPLVHSVSCGCFIPISSCFKVPAAIGWPSLCPRLAQLLVAFSRSCRIGAAPANGLP